MSPKIQNLRVASYNIRKAVGLDRQRKPGRILDVINGLDADLVALQEADKRLGQRRSALPRDLIAHHTDFEIVPVATNDVSLGWHGNAILVRTGLRTSRPGRVALPSLEPRGAVSVTLEMDEPVTIIAIHLGLTRRHRRHQLRALKRKAQTAPNAIILGDFNEWSPTRGFEPLAEFDVVSPGTTYHAARPVAALDRIALSGCLTLKGAGVVESGLARRASDHLPIWADVQLNASL